MGNQFIGFPVPRARIADMIAGSAPPKIHHTNHETGGGDEVDCTGLAGAGGISLPLRDFWQDFRHMDTNLFYHAYTGSGSLVRSYQKLTLATGNTNPSTCICSHNITHPIVPLTWAKARNIITRSQYYMDDNATGIIRFFTGKLGNYNHMGFEASGSKLYGINGNSGGTTTTELASYSPGAVGGEILLEAILFPGNRVEFWADGALAGTSTTNIPTGTSRAELLFEWNCDNGSTTNQVEIMFNHAQFYQEG